MEFYSDQLTLQCTDFGCPKQTVWIVFHQKSVVMSHASNLTMPLQVVQLKDIFVTSCHVFVENVAFERYIRY